MERRLEKLNRLKSIRVEDFTEEDAEVLEKFEHQKRVLTPVFKQASFFHRLDEAQDIDYTIIVDRSGSMKGSRWRQAREAVELLAEEAVSVSLFFSTLIFFFLIYKILQYLPQ
jgi:hypothetical protein